ncbi:nucleoside triphosphate pyrophosphohydrolase family protein [Crenobacter luteus]|uniref:Phosphoribosyl-ATP pyrophosphohydrolase n=1 Tax=Crenobacter luteus TaxID=1452487 RepID=A0A165FBA2_9NEIS|nr:nucleoside triphosphate pyrophosphohydrolase family protein [Crenobacter luteus]KZE32689.1 phosphoribosyl-ATP pyrophosphohydrolase [Crenobacter luteus]
MRDFVAARRDFMRRFDLPAPASPRFEPAALALWQTMLTEEWDEFRQALADYARLAEAGGDDARRRRAELAAEGVDLINVVIGLLLSQGLPVAAMFDAIHAANLAKCVDGRVLRRADGKILKPAGWQAADKEGVIAAAEAGGRR